MIIQARNAFLLADIPEFHQAVRGTADELHALTHEVHPEHCVDMPFESLFNMVTGAQLG